MKKDPFEEYIAHKEPQKAEKGYAWHTAIGLQAVDGIKTSDYLAQTAVKNIEGEITMDEAQQLIDSYYKENRQHFPNDRTEEADKVSARIAAILSEKAFTFSPQTYISIHFRLFQGIYKFAGEVRDYNISKKEWVLNGNTVLYGNAFELRAALDYDFEQERKFNYKGLTLEQTVAHLSLFIARLWQIHAFGEGNTRTTAVFFIKYLSSLGFEVTNDIFAKNAWYFRNALVRANYNDIKNGVHETTEFLELFFKNLLLGENHSLHNRNLHISGLLCEGQEGEKQDIDSEKQDIDSEKQDIEAENGKCELTEHAKAQLTKLQKQIGMDVVFGRTDVKNVLGITASPASELLKKLLSANAIVPVSGCGKGKYKFEKDKL